MKTSQENNLNYKPVSDHTKESGYARNKHGYFYNGNKGMDIKETVKAEGSVGLAYDQGQKRISYSQPYAEGFTGHETKKKLPYEGSHAHLLV